MVCGIMVLLLWAFNGSVFPQEGDKSCQLFAFEIAKESFGDEKMIALPSKRLDKKVW